MTHITDHKVEGTKRRRASGGGWINRGGGLIRIPHVRRSLSSLCRCLYRFILDVFLSTLYPYSLIVEASVIAASSSAAAFYFASNACSMVAPAASAASLVLRPIVATMSALMVSYTSDVCYSTARRHELGLLLCRLFSFQLPFCLFHML